MIVTLCGSAKFEGWFHIWNQALGLSGHSVFGLSGYPSQNKGEKDWYTDHQKAVLDMVHLRKIQASDAVLVLNPFAYVGESVLREIAWAQGCGKAVHMLESWGRGCGSGLGAKFGVPAGYTSPIDSHRFPDPWSLLPEPGAYRSSIVEFINRRTRALGS